MKKYILTLITAVLLTLTCAQPGLAAPRHDTRKPPVYYRNQVAVLLYHNLDKHENGITITPQRFQQHLDMLQQEGYNVIDLKTLDLFLRGQANIPPNAVLITFDDGYQSVYQYAYPVLKKRHMPATLFVIVNHMGATDGEIPKITWEEAKEMEAAGFSIQSHSYDSHAEITINELGDTGPALTSRIYFRDKRHFESEYEYKERIKKDLTLSRSVLKSKLGQPSIFLAVPLGKENRSVEEVAKKTGFKYIFTTVPGLIDAKTTPTQLNRINAGQADLSAPSLQRRIMQYTEDPEEYMD